MSLLWTSMMFLYVYNDYISMYAPDTIEMMREGRMGPAAAGGGKAVGVGR